jgi:hypothetical protein
MGMNHDLHDLDDAYQAAWLEQELQWKRLREWRKRVCPDSKLPKRTHLMDFSAGWCAAVRAMSPKPRKRFK